MVEAVDTADESAEEVEPRAIPVHGRDILVKPVKDVQLVQMNHEVAITQSSNADNVRKMKAVDRIHRILLSVVIEDADKDFIEDLMADGELKMEDLLEFISAFNDEKVPKKAVRRGRPVRRR